MTFRAYNEVIGYVNKQGGGIGMLLRWGRKYVYTMYISLISAELNFLQGHMRK